MAIHIREISVEEHGMPSCKLVKVWQDDQPETAEDRRVIRSMVDEILKEVAKKPDR